MSKATQIGWYTLKTDKIFRKTYECAAWYKDVLVKAGKYPVFVYDFRVLKHEDPKFNGRIEGHIGGTYTHMDGTVISDEFGTRFFGVPVGYYDNSKNAGDPASHSMLVYMHEVADSVLNDPESPWELLPEYEARAIHGEWDGNPFTTHAIYKRQGGAVMLKQRYRCGIYCFDLAEPQDARLIDEVSFTVESPDEKALRRAAAQKLGEISSGLKDGQFIDDIKWSDLQEAAPEEKEEVWW